MTCPACNAQEIVSRTLPTYNGDLIGAPFSVVIENAVIEESCAKCGFVCGIGMPNLQGLVAAVAMTRALHPQKLCGSEIRFLRGAVGCKSIQLADKLGVDPATVSRWESGTQAVSESYEKHLRLFVCVSLMDLAPLADFSSEKLVNLKINAVRSGRSTLELRCWLAEAACGKEAGGDKWRFAPAA